MKRPTIFGAWMLWMLTGALMLLYTLFSAGVSFVYPARAVSWTDAEELAAGTGFSRPCREFRFDTVIFTGLYLCTGEDDTPTDWVMCGYLDGKFIPFYVPVSAGDPPEDQQHVSYLLRRPTAGNAMHSEWVVASLTDDIADTGSYTHEQAEAFFTAAVLQADRNGAVQLLIVALSGVALILLGALFLGLHLRRRFEPPKPPVIYAESPAASTPSDGAELPGEPEIPAEAPPEEEPGEPEEPEDSFGFEHL